MITIKRIITFLKFFFYFNIFRARILFSLKSLLLLELLKLEWSLLKRCTILVTVLNTILFCNGGSFFLSIKASKNCWLYPVISLYYIDVIVRSLLCCWNLLCYRIEYYIIYATLLIFKAKDFRMLFLKFIFVYEFCVIVEFHLVWFYGTSTIVVYLMPNPFLYI